MANCPNCGEASLTVLVSKEENIVHCSGCDADWKLQELRDVSENLAKLVKWIETAPFLEKT